MLTRTHSLIRYSLCFLAFSLLLGTPFLVGQRSRRPNQKAAAKPQATPAPSPVPLPQIEKMDTEMVRGGAVTFKGQNFPTNPKDITVFLNGTRAGTAALASPDKQSFIFAVPTDLSLGEYNVRIDFKINNIPEPLPVIPPEPKLLIYGEAGKTELKITAVNPLLTYPEKEVYGFDIIGEGFSKKGSDNGLVINRVEVQNICWDDDKGCKADDTTRVHGKAVSTRQLTFSGIPGKHRGIKDVQIRVGQNYSDPFQVTLSRVGSGIPAWVSLGVFVILFGLVLWLTSRGLRTSPIAGRRYGLITALFLDKETDTYSLSRFQFFVWTAAAIFSYVYLVLSRSLVQWKLEFVDVPANLPGIILISAGTTVLAQGITNSKGTKGAGEIHPSMSDFISIGGVVVPERFQFFLWTVLGVGVFLFLVLLNDPGTIKDLPQIPIGFLELMGVSSAGYLGGKLARKPGPIIDEILSLFGSLELTIKGRNLSKDASFLIEGDEVSSDNIEGRPRMVVDDEHPSTNMGKELRFTIKDPKPEWLKNNTKLTIVNPDGQKAVWMYNVVEVTVDDGGLVTVTAKVNSASLEVEGVELETSEGKSWPTKPEWKVIDDTVTLTADPSQLSSGILVITSRTGIKTRVPFTIEH